MAGIRYTPVIEDLHWTQWAGKPFNIKDSSYNNKWGGRWPTQEEVNIAVVYWQTTSPKQVAPENWYPPGHPKHTNEKVPIWSGVVGKGAGASKPEGDLRATEEESPMARGSQNVTSSSTTSL